MRGLAGVGTLLFLSTAASVTVLARDSLTWPTRAELESNLLARDERNLLWERDANSNGHIVTKGLHGQDVHHDLVQPSRDLHPGSTSAGNVWKRTNNVTEAELNACPGYYATSVKTTPYYLTAKLVLAGKACNVYGPDLAELSLSVTYETGGCFTSSSLVFHVVRWTVDYLVCGDRSVSPHFGHSVLGPE